MNKLVEFSAILMLIVCAIAVIVLGFYTLILILTYVILPLMVVGLVFCGMTILFGYIKGLTSNGRYL